MPQYELNLRDYLRIFRKRRVIIIMTFILVAFFNFYYLSKGANEYKATATVKIEERKTIAGLLTEWIVYSPGDVMESETKFITSFPVMSIVAVEMQKVPKEWFENPADINPLKVKREFVEELNNIVSQLQSSIETERIANTNMIKITATSDKPWEAMNLANTVSRVYLKANLKEKNEQATNAREFIQTQLNTLEENLKVAEKKLKEMGEKSEQIRLAEPIERKLVELQFSLSELLQRYTDRHPQVIQLREQIKTMEKEARGFSEQQLVYARLAREVEVNKKLYGVLKEKLEEARISEAGKISSVSIVNPAVLPQVPVTGDRNIKIIIGAVLGLVLGIALAFIFETLDTSIGTIEDVENVIKLPVLGIVPPIEEESKLYRNIISRLKERFVQTSKTDSEERFVHLFAHYKPHSPVTEAFRNIHTNLKLSPARKTILVTSSGPREGKSCVACNLALVMAQIGLKTLLVSTDLRRPILAKIFGIKRAPGLSELVRGTAVMENVLRNVTDILLGDLGLEEIRKTPGIENIWILPSGDLPSNPVEVLESKSLGNVIQTFKERFDVIIFDAPPVLPVTDASLLAPKLDSVIIIYEIGRTSREGLMRPKVQLEAVGARIAGVVLNHTQPQSEVVSPYPYYNKYRYYDKTLEKGTQKKKVHTRKT